MKIGDKFGQRIDEAIRVYDKLLLVLTENPVKSAWVEKEVEAAEGTESGAACVFSCPIGMTQ